MELLLHRAPSVGKIVKKIVEINPQLTTQAVIEIVRRSTRVQGGTESEFARAEIIDETRALELARATLAG
ncbi:MAG: hypothetical protein NDJ89_04135 [Oligoflexia bacterium]|nr:hypothetical protein [Oligoflexia bacterium]